MLAGAAVWRRMKRRCCARSGLGGWHGQFLNLFKYRSAAVTDDDEMPQSQPQGSFGIQLQGYNVLKELPRSSSRTRTYRIRPRLHDDLPRYMASEETCYVLKCISVTGAGHKPKSRGAANESQVLREMSALIKLRHSNLVPCHKVFLQDGRVWTMMGSMDTGSLQDVIAGLNKGLDRFEDFKDLSAPAGAVRFEPRLIWHFLIQALEGLERLHRCSIIHRALKPSNLLLEPETCYTHTDFRWRLKISDVAVPELLRRDNSKIPATRLRYMAPELLAASSPYDSKVRTARIARLSPLTPPPPAINPRAAEALAVPPNPMPMRASSPPPPVPSIRRICGRSVVHSSRCSRCGAPSRQPATLPLGL